MKKLFLTMLLACSGACVDSAIKPDLVTALTDRISSLHKQHNELFGTEVFKKGNDFGQVLGLPNFEDIKEKKLQFVLSALGSYTGGRCGAYLYKNSFHPGRIRNTVRFDKAMLAHGVVTNKFDKAVLSFFIRAAPVKIFLQTSVACILGMHIGKYIGSGIANGCYAGQNVIRGAMKNSKQ